MREICTSVKKVKRLTKRSSTQQHNKSRNDKKILTFNFVWTFSSLSFTCTYVRSFNLLTYLHSSVFVEFLENSHSTFYTRLMQLYRQRKSNAVLWTFHFWVNYVIEINLINFLAYIFCNGMI